MDVSVIFALRAYFSYDFDRFLLINFLGKSVFEKCIELLCNYYRYLT